MGKVAEFQVSSGHVTIPIRLRVIVYDNLEQVRKLGGEWAGGKAYDGNTFGVTNKQAIYKDDSDKLSRLECIIRLDKDHSPTGLVAHEVTHAAVYFFVNSGNRLHKDSPIEKEELFCYLLGDLFHKVTKKMHTKGIWS